MPRPPSHLANILGLIVCAFLLHGTCAPATGAVIVGADDDQHPAPDTVRPHFATAVRPLITRLCADCHSGDTPNGAVDLEQIFQENLEQSFDTWEAAAAQLAAGTMPPADMPQPTDAEKRQVAAWLQQLITETPARPGVFRPRRLAVNEYRNTLRSLFGFDLQVNIMKAEQTISESSMVVKLMPLDPPGRSGFKNDTHSNRLSVVAWDQYSYIADAAIARLFGPEAATQRDALAGEHVSLPLDAAQASRLLEGFAARAYRRSPPASTLAAAHRRLAAAPADRRTEAVRSELKTILMSPAFLYRGLLVTGPRGQQHAVDDFELAERLSYFFWADMPDEELRQLAADGRLQEESTIRQQVQRLLHSDKARSLTDDFATQWLTLQEIEHVSDNVPKMVALKSQPEDFMNYLFTENRPLTELIDSDTAFISPHTAKMYGADARQMPRYRKQKGIEVEIVANHRIRLEATDERGGLLTMPGILAMNRGPIIRGTWILERILGDELPEPPANVGQVPPSPQGQELPFRERFEQHRANPSCAVCHDRIDPLGFALARFDQNGGFRRNGRDPQGNPIDTSGRLPTGETFTSMAELKTLLLTARRESVVRNIVERTMSYALCRHLTIYDRPVVEAITHRMLTTNGTWQDLFTEICCSLPFRETILSELADTTVATHQKDQP